MVNSRILRDATMAVALLALPVLISPLTPPARGATAASVKTPIVEISVDVDEALKAYPGVFDNCAAEAKSYAAAMRAQAEKEHREDPAAFRDGMQWTYDRAYTLRSVVGGYVSIVRSDDTFEGGAHPNHAVDTILWDSRAQKRISIRPFFTETADNGPTMKALAEAAKLAVAGLKIANDIPVGDEDKLPADITPAQYLRRDTFINDGIKPSLLRLGPVTLAPSTEAGKSSGLTFHYSPYAVGPYVEGSYTAFVPWTAFRQYLSPDGAALFGGTRPSSDADKW
ncbi:MAG TPA: RsiV family protein [Xanthobacteraceae bacterium]|nr:RsiV family protein [Xanthobacteraceae bacterium]